MSIPSDLHLLVIEDNPDLLHEAATFCDGFIQRTARNLTLRVSYATNLEEALPLLPSINGVMCDTLFPVASGSPLRPHSIEVVEHCRALSKPVVVLRNALDEHFFDLEEELKASIVQHMPLFGINMKGRISLEGYDPAPTWKPWNQALHGLLYLIRGLQYATFQFDSDGNIVPRKPFPEFVDHFPLAVCEALLDYEKKWSRAFANLSPHNLRKWAWLYTSDDPQLQVKRREMVKEDYLSQKLQL